MANDPNVALVQAGYADFMNRDMAAFLDRCTDDIAWTMPHPSDRIPFGGTWTGKDGVQAFFTSLAGSYQIVAFEPHVFIASGDHVVAIVSIDGFVRRTGLDSAGEVVHVFRLRDGKICAFREYAGDTDALLAAFTAQPAASSS